MPGTRFKLFIAATALLACTVWLLPGWSAQAGAVTSEQPAEFMIYQYPATILVLKVDVPEVEFGVQTIGPEDAMIRASSVTGRRVGPVFQFIESVDRARQLMIEVRPARAVERSAIRLELLQFDADDPNVTVLARAYQLFSTGAETSHSTDASTWAMKAYSLRNASAAFSGLGMEEMRLWSEYFAAHLVLHRLDDPLTALELLEEVRSGAERAGYDQIQLAAGILEADAVLRQVEPSSADQDPEHYSRAHDVLTRVAVLAGRLGLAAEQGRALFRDGQVFEMQGDAEQALRRYGAALEVTAVSGDGELLNQIRSTAATAYESLGRTSGALGLLDDIAGDLADATEPDANLELAGRLLDKGRLLNDNYRYAEAINELSRAFSLRGSHAESEPWGLIGLELAWSHYSLGDADEAVRLLERVLPVVSGSSDTRALARAYGSLANTYRTHGLHEQAAAYRDRQGALVRGGAERAGLLLAAATDAGHRYGPGSNLAGDLLKRARQAATAAKDAVGVARADLALCLLELQRGRNADCVGGAAESAYGTVRNAGIPRLAAAAGLDRARILREAGRSSEAWRAMQGLVDELFRYQNLLPGVLGAWIAENREAISAEYLSLARSNGAPAAAVTGNGKALLWALEQVRLLEQASFARPGDPRLERVADESLRGLLARREAASGAEAARLAEEINRQLAAARRELAPIEEVFSATALDRLLASLSESESVLAYCFDGERVSALLGRRDGVRLVDLPRAADISKRLRSLRDGLVRPGAVPINEQLDALGRMMIRPLETSLPEKIYLLSTGPLRGIPFDALRSGGKYLAEDHQLVNLTSLSAIGRRAARLPGDFPVRVFLAGNPQELRDPFSLEVRTSPEITAVADRFVGPGLHIVQGVALRIDEFSDDRFRQAGLIHLALSGTVDLNAPDRSRLLLASGAAGSSGAATESDGFMPAAEIRAFDLEARLVVLSGTVVGGSNPSLVDSRIALVADFSEAGSAAVLATLWPVGEAFAADFSGDLYRELLPGSDLEGAVANAKRAHIRSGRQTNLGSWAGFQLFIR